MVEIDVIVAQALGQSGWACSRRPDQDEQL
ncbi:MAG: hypothetical protein RLZZ206_2534 [Cyanobacteriota bacterium]|jgi:hypothetical protein